MGSRKELLDRVTATTGGLPRSGWRTNGLDGPPGRPGPRVPAGVRAPLIIIPAGEVLLRDAARSAVEMNATQRPLAVAALREPLQRARELAIDANPNAIEMLVAYLGQAEADALATTGFAVMTLQVGGIPAGMREQMAKLLGRTAMTEERQLYAEHYAERGRLLRILGKRDAALAEISRALEIDDKCDLAHWERGVINYHQDAKDSAQRDFAAAPKSQIRFLVQAGFALDRVSDMQTKGEVNQPGGYQRAADRLREGHALVLRELGFAVLGSDKGAPGTVRQHDAMLQFVELAVNPASALNYRQDFVNALYTQGHFRRMSKALEAALACFNDVDAMTPNDQEVIGNIGICLHALGRAEEAVPVFERWHGLEAAPNADPDQINDVLSVECYAKAECAAVQVLAAGRPVTAEPILRELAPAFTIVREDTREGLGASLRKMLARLLRRGVPLETVAAVGRDSGVEELQADEWMGGLVDVASDIYFVEGVPLGFERPEAFVEEVGRVFGAAAVHRALGRVFALQDDAIVQDAVGQVMALEGNRPRPRSESIQQPLAQNVNKALGQRSVPLWGLLQAQTLGGADAVVEGLLIRVARGLMEGDIAPARVRDLLSLGEDRAVGNRLVLRARQARMEDAFTQRGLAAREEVAGLRASLESGGITGIDEFDAAVTGYIDAAWERFLTTEETVVGRVREFWPQGEAGNESLDELVYRAHLRTQNQVEVNTIGVPETCLLVARALAEAGASAEEVYQVFRRSGDRWERDQREAGRRVAAVVVSVEIQRVYAIGQFPEIAEHRPAISEFISEEPALAGALRAVEADAEMQACVQVAADPVKRAAHLGYWIEHFGGDLSATIQPFLRQLQREKPGTETGAVTETRRLLTDLATRLLGADVLLPDIRRQFALGEAQFADPILVEIFLERVRAQLADPGLSAVIPCRKMVGDLRAAGVVGVDGVGALVESEMVRLTDAIMEERGLFLHTVAELWSEGETRQGELDVLLQRVFAGPQQDEEDCGGFKVRSVALAAAYWMPGLAVNAWEPATQEELTRVDAAFSRNGGGSVGRTALAALVSDRTRARLESMIRDGNEIFVAGRGGAPRRLRPGDIRDAAVNLVRARCGRPAADQVNRFLLAETKRIEREISQGTPAASGSTVTEEDVFSRIKRRVSAGGEAQRAALTDLRRVLLESKTAEDATLLAFELWEQEDLRPALVEMFVAGLQRGGSLEILLDRIRRNLLREAQSEDRVSTLPGTVVLNAIFPTTPEMRRAQRIHDFFADVLWERDDTRDAVARVFRFINVDYASPVNLESEWFGMLSDQFRATDKEPSFRLRFVEDAIAKDPRNIVARLQQANFLSQLGRYDESDRALDEAAALSDHPLVGLRANAVRLASLGSRIRDYFAARQRQETIAGFDLSAVMERIQQVCSAISNAFDQLGPMVEAHQLGVNALREIQIERQVILQNLQSIGFMFARKHLFKASIPFYREVVRIDPEEASLATCMLAMMQLELGQHTVALDILNKVVNHNGSRAQALMREIIRIARKSLADPALPPLRLAAAKLSIGVADMGYWMVEAYIYGGQFELAMALLESDNKPKATLFKAKIFAVMAMYLDGDNAVAAADKAERFLAEYSRLLAAPKPTIHPVAAATAEASVLDMPLAAGALGVISSLPDLSLDKPSTVSMHDQLLSAEEHYVRSVLLYVNSRRAGDDAISMLEQAAAEAQAAAEILKDDLMFEYNEIEARAAGVYYLTKLASLAPEGEQATKAEVALTEAEVLVHDYPFAPLARRRAVSPLMLLDRNREAIKQLQHISDAGLFDPEDLTNVLLISVDPAVREQARQILSGWKDQFIEKSINWDQAIVSARGLIEVLNPSWMEEHGTELDQVLASLPSAG
ncbi:MAG: hypothetical protein WC901_00025 [Candidatus Margulisiibacteriota bacterium]